MILVVDGYNLLFHPEWRPKGITLEERRTHLIKEMAKYRQRENIRRLLLVFDGRSGIGPYGRSVYNSGIEIIYAICAGKADEKIVALCHELNGVRVVTADRKLARKAKYYKASVISPENFLQQWRLPTSTPEIEEKEKEPLLLAETELDDWLNLFGLEAEIEIPDKKEE